MFVSKVSQMQVSCAYGDDRYTSLRPVCVPHSDNDSFYKKLRTEAF